MNEEEIIRVILDEAFYIHKTISSKDSVLCVPSDLEKTVNLLSFFCALAPNDF